jgi:hypothetical protein
MVGTMVANASEPYTNGHPRPIRMRRGGQQLLHAGMTPAERSSSVFSRDFFRACSRMAFRRAGMRQLLRRQCDAGL